LYSIKKRPAEKDLPLIAADAGMVRKFCDVSHPTYGALAAGFWPGPLSLVLPARDHSATYAVRVSSHEIARQLSLAFLKPIVSTSANLSGEEPVRDPMQLSDVLKVQISLLIDNGLTAGGQPSTILSLLEDSPRVLREGAIPSSKLAGIL
jgi:L-threonylcarbamoyladenylate synthase